MDTIVVNDTNIFIDLISVGLLDDFFKLPMSVHTTDFVINELTEVTQYEAVMYHASQNNLKIIRYSSSELAELISFHENCQNNVSIVDCSVWMYAQKNGYTLLTGDGKLRNSASKSGVKVCGILHVFDLLVEEFKVISKNAGADCLEMLYKINNRLPSNEIENRIVRWRH